MARAQGINTDFHTVLALMISNGLVGLSGGLYAQYQGAADVNMGRGAIVIGLAAVIIGDVLFGKMCAGKKIAFAYTLLSVIAGAILYYLVLSDCFMVEIPIRRPEIILCNCSSYLPFNPVSESET